MTNFMHEILQIISILIIRLQAVNTKKKKSTEDYQQAEFSNMEKRGDGIYSEQVIFFPPEVQIKKYLKFNYVINYINRIRKKIKDLSQ